MYCATNDEQAINDGVSTVKRILADNFVRPDEAEKIKSKIKEQGIYTIIDKVTVRLNERQDIYQAEFSNLGIKDAYISEEEWENPEFRAACRKYVALQDSNRYVRLLQASQEVTDKIIDYFDNLDLNATDDQGKPLVKIADIQKAMDQSVKQIESLKQIEALVKKEVMEQSQIRGGAVEGFMPDD